jgi:Zn-dependent peptidase ImmA (M78 family)
MAAARLHQKLGLRKDIEANGGNVDAFGAIHAVDLPLLLRPLQGLLGVYLNEPTPGVLVTTQRPMSIQRFTAAHELGHFSMRHLPSVTMRTFSGACRSRASRRRIFRRSRQTPSRSSS